MGCERVAQGVRRDRLPEPRVRGVALEQVPKRPGQRDRTDDYGQARPPIGVPFREVSAGYAHSCGIKSDGMAFCWGRNSSGQLGNGTTEDSTTPVDVVGLKARVVAISGSADTMCALSRGGAVQCWGNNEFGGLGNGTTISSSTPVDVTGLGSGATAVAVGSHACAIVQSGGVRCWGYNHYGELGDGTWTDSSVPIDVVALHSGATAIGAHYYNSCALLSDGRVMCWGDDSQGQLGQGGP